MLLKAFTPPFPRKNCLPLAVGQQAALWHHPFSNLWLSCVHLTHSRSALLTTRFGTKASSALLWPLRQIPLSCPSARGFHIRPPKWPTVLFSILPQSHIFFSRHLFPKSSNSFPFPCFSHIIPRIKKTISLLSTSPDSRLFFKTQWKTLLLHDIFQDCCTYSC